MGVYVRDHEDQVRFGSRHFELGFEKSTGAWVALVDKRKDRELVVQGETDAIRLVVGGTERRVDTIRDSRIKEYDGALEEGADRRLRRWYQRDEGYGKALVVEAETPHWIIRTSYGLSDDPELFWRSVEVEWRGDEGALLRRCDWSAPVLLPGPAEGAALFAPGYQVHPHVPIRALAGGVWPGTDSRIDPEANQIDVDVPGWKPGVVGIEHGDNVVSTWPQSSGDPVIVEVEGSDAGPRIVHQTLMAGRIAPGEAWAGPRQWIYVGHDGWRASLKRYQCWLDEVGIACASDAPAWVDRPTIFEAHVGTAKFPGRDYAPYPTVDVLIDDVERIKSLGFDTLLLMPRMPFPSYTVHDFMDIETHYGDPEELRQLVDALHRRGMKIIIDVILHGCIDKALIETNVRRFGKKFAATFRSWSDGAHERSPYLDHPEWFSRTESGEIASVYTYAFDAANSEWQTFMIDVLRHYVETLDIDGFRIDAPTWNFFANWRAGLPYRGSYSVYGVVRLFERARQALRDVKPDLFWFTEPTGALFRSVTHASYNYDEQWLVPALIDVPEGVDFSCPRQLGGPPLDPRALGEWLEMRRLCQPHGAVVVHHLDSHDTFWWGGLAKFRHEVFGDDACRAMFFLLSFLDGGIMNYAGGEGPSEDFYREALRLRKETRAVREGHIDYLACRSEERVVAFLWYARGAFAVPVVNLSDAPFSGEIEVDLRSVAGAGDLVEIMAGRGLRGFHFDEEVLRLSVELPGYGTALVTADLENSRLEQAV